MISAVMPQPYKQASGAVREKVQGRPIGKATHLKVRLAIHPSRLFVLERQRAFSYRLLRILTETH